jgi:AcrR family transcriptional regulator
MNEASTAVSVREMILDAAHQLFAEEGYHSVSMRRLAQIIGYSPTTIYIYFKNKGEVFQCLLERIFQEQLEAVQKTMERGLPHRDALRRMLHDYVRMGLENPSAYKVGFMRETDLWPRSEDHFPEGSYATRLYELFTSAVARAMVPEPRDPETVHKAACAAWAAVHGVTSLLVTYPSFPWGDVDDLIDNVIDAAMKGIS